MNFKKTISTLLLPFGFLFLLVGVKAQDSTSTVNVTADFMSRYIWRGADYGSSPAIQPTLSWNCHNRFEMGIWGSFNTKGTYSETDPYMKFIWKAFSFTLTDYFILNDTTSVKPDFFNIDKKETNHCFEATLQYKSPGKYPFSILVGSYFLWKRQGLGLR